MPNYGDFGHQRYKEQAQMLNLRGSQMVEAQTGVKASDVVDRKARGTQKQLIGTIAGIGGVIIIGLILHLLGVI